MVFSVSIALLFCELSLSSAEEGFCAQICGHTVLCLLLPAIKLITKKIYDDNTYWNKNKILVHTCISDYSNQNRVLQSMTFNNCKKSTIERIKFSPEAYHLSFHAFCSSIPAMNRAQKHHLIDCLQIHFALRPDDSDYHRLKQKIRSLEAIHVDILHVQES